MAASFGSSDYQYNPNNPPWRKLLWVKQNYPDNYVDETFLEELQKNGKRLSLLYFGLIPPHLSL
jgi:phosphatidylinositol glycan class C protein